MRLDAHATRPADRPSAGRSARSATALPPFFSGMTRTARAALHEALDETGGLILVAGPPGSGRATTLRSLLRARPDALAVGDIGSPERAAAAVRAARGRLVLGTVDAGDSLAALGLVARLRVEPFAIACVLRLILAQRVTRRLCPSCRAPMQPPDSVTAPLGLEPGSVVYQALGCGSCGGEGFAGSIGAFETMPVDAHVGRLIVCGSEQAAIAGHVFRTCPNLAAAVRALVVQGLAGAEGALALLRPQRQ